jgi:hypothetical protein
MSGAVGVERILPVNLPALQKSLKLTKLLFVELEFSLRNLQEVKKSKTKEEIVCLSLS